jgi:hypothetical protein
MDAQPGCRTRSRVMPPSGPHRALVVAVLASTLSACAERQARPISAEQAHDGQLSCFQIASERAAHHKTIGSYTTDRQHQDERNALSAMAAPLNPMTLMLMDGGNATDRETEAYRQRISRLDALARGKGCPDE